MSETLKSVLLAIALVPGAALAVTGPDEAETQTGETVTIERPAETAQGPAPCTQLEMSVGIDAAECGTMTKAELARIWIDMTD
ncbi:hypothetical protein AADZ90_000340 [Aestuariibius sp. 2305UL40-4]|uniref:hypothetical protein n=1 Tax=Aestuariibius violaceus TaxID=3234132 RepID=UPI00345E2E32